MEVRLSGKLSARVQWDLDHHESVLYLDDTSLLQMICERLGIEYTENKDIEIGKFIITLSPSHTDSPSS